MSSPKLTKADVRVSRNADGSGRLDTRDQYEGGGFGGSSIHLPAPAPAPKR